MTTMDVVKYKFEGSRQHIDRLYINGQEKEMPKGRRIAKPIPQELWADMKAAGYPYQSMDYVITANRVEYTYKASKDHGYVEGVELMGVEYVHSSGKKFKLVPKISLDYGNKPRERELLISNDERQFIIYVIPKSEITPEILASSSFFHTATPQSRHLNSPINRRQPINRLLREENPTVPKQTNKPQLPAPRTEWDTEAIDKLVKIGGGIALSFGALKLLGVF